MKKIAYESIVFIDNKEDYISGSFGSIKRCKYDKKIYAYKEFNDPNYVKGKIRKFELISEINSDRLLLPKFWIQENQNLCYLADFIQSKNLNYYKNFSIDTKIKILKKIKESILNMHENNIIHTDLHNGNIIIDDNLNPYIIDFDNCSYKKYKTDIKDANDYSQEFIKKYGIIPEIDIFMFNLLTYSFINEINYYRARINILFNEENYFNSKESKQVLNSLFLDNNYPNKDFLIDTIDDTTFRI